MKYTLWAWALVLLITTAVQAQQEQPLSLDQAFSAALAHNDAVQQATLDEEMAQARYRQTQAVFLPQITVSYGAMTTNNPLQAFGFKLQQRTITQNDFNPELLNEPDQTWNFMAKAAWQQPLINMDMLYKRHAARRQQDVYAYTTVRTKEYLRFETENAYHQLQLAWQAWTVWEASKRTMQAIETTTKDRLQKGLLQKSDLLQVQVQVTAVERRLAEAASNISNASDYLSLMMGADPGVRYRTEHPDTTAQWLEADVNTTVPSTRADLQALQAAVEAQHSMATAAKMNALPSLNAFAEYTFNDAEAFGFGADAYLAGVQLSWTLFQGMAARNRTVEQRLQQEKLSSQLHQQQQQSQLELNKTIRQWQDARYALQQHQVAVAHAAEALRILQNRHAQGLVPTTTLLQSETMLQQQKLQQAQAVYQYAMALAYIQFLTSTSSDL